MTGKVSGFLKLLPRNILQVISLVAGVLGIILWCGQRGWHWFGADAADEVLYSVIVLICESVAFGFMWANSRFNKNDKTVRAGLKYTLWVASILFAASIVISLSAMGMDATYMETADASGVNIFYALRYLSNVTAEDVNALAQWGIGLQTIIKALFYVVPFIIVTWGALSVLTSDSIDEAEGGILAIVAAFVFAIIMWIFRLASFAI